MAEPPEHLARAALRLRGFRSRHVETSEGTVHLVEGEGMGSGPPVVLLHGFGSTGVHYGPLLHRLRPHVSKLVAPDMPAHGFSERPKTGMRPSTLLNGLFEALDRVIDEPAIVFGNSMGGYAAVRYARDRPENVRGLVLASPAGAVTDTSEEDIAHIRRVFDIDDHRKALAFIDRLLARGTMLRHVMAWGVRRKFTHPDLRALLDAIEPSEGLSPHEIRSLEMPLLFLWGEHERILPPNHLDFWHAHLPEHAERERPLGMGHSPFLDRPGALTKRLLEFIEKV